MTRQPVEDERKEKGRNRKRDIKQEMTNKLEEEDSFSRNDNSIKKR